MSSIGNRINAVVSSAHAFDLEGCGQGSAHRNHPHWIQRGQLLLLNPWNRNYEGSVYVLTDAEATVRPGSTDSCSHGNPYPKPTLGELHRVMHWGTWEVMGPWQLDTEALLDSLEAEIAEIRAEQERLVAKRRADEQLMAIAHRESLIAAYTAGQDA